MDKTIKDTVVNQTSPKRGDKDTEGGQPSPQKGSPGRTPGPKVNISKAPERKTT